MVAAASGGKLMEEGYPTVMRGFCQLRPGPALSAQAVMIHSFRNASILAPGAKRWSQDAMYIIPMYPRGEFTTKDVTVSSMAGGQQFW